ncbi:hypothetical protein L218DRAFT_900845 [Marasmius fiardii PR-910]|nr:hypothetical protein L218DRAFT_900845 [Marasmius fiardii PR-910]
MRLGTTLISLNLVNQQPDNLRLHVSKSIQSSLTIPSTGKCMSSTLQGYDTIFIVGSGYGKSLEFRGVGLLTLAVRELQYFFTSRERPGLCKIVSMCAASNSGGRHRNRRTHQKQTLVLVVLLLICDPSGSLVLQNHFQESGKVVRLLQCTPFICSEVGA